MGITIYGIRNCDTMKKTFAWFEAAGLGYEFHDWRKAGVDAGKLAGWCERLGWQKLVNTRGTTWRKLAPEQQAIAGNAEAVALMAAQPSVIRRPLIALADGELLVGFDADAYASRFGIHGDAA